MLTAEQNERLTQVGPGTPGGELMRRYWHPIAASSQIKEPGTRPVRILCEDLVLYRDQRGRVGLVADRCAHRLAALALGIPEEEGLRCAYHGWLYDASGQCIEQPYEDQFHSELRFKEKIKIKAYPVEEMGGLVWAYLGPEPAPLLPRWETFVKEGVHREVGMTLLPANWLQISENGEGWHVRELHGRFSRYVLKRLGLEGASRNNSTSGGGVRQNTPGNVEVEMGAMRVKTGEGPAKPATFDAFPATSFHSDGHAQIKVPVDDTHTQWFYYLTFDVEEVGEETGIHLEPINESRDVPTFEVPLPRVVGDWANPDWENLDNNSGQDQMIVSSIGPIMDRTAEHLGPGDTKTIAKRKQLEEQIRLVEDGGDPIYTFRDPDQNRCITVMDRMEKRGNHDALRNNLGRIDRTQSVRKFSPVYRAMDAKERGEEALKEPVH